MAKGFAIYAAPARPPCVRRSSATGQRQTMELCDVARPVDVQELEAEVRQLKREQDYAAPQAVPRKFRRGTPPGARSFRTQPSGGRSDKRSAKLNRGW